VGGGGGDVMATAKLSDVKLVLDAPHQFRSRRKPTEKALVAYFGAIQEFCRRATPAAWAHLVAASRQLHAVVKPEWEKRLKS